MHMYMYTVNVFINEDSFTVYKDMFFVRVAKHVMCDTGIACFYTALQCQYVHILSLTEPPESIYPLARGKTSSLPKGSAANSPRWDEFLNLVLDGRNRTPRQARRGIPR